MSATIENETDQDAQFDWENLLDYIADSRVVPVLGHELLEAQYEGERTTLQRLIARRLKDSQGLALDGKVHFELSEAVAAYLEMPGVRPDDPYLQVCRIQRQLEPAFPVPPALAQLAQIRPLDLFVSTTPDDLMAVALDLERHGGRPITHRLAFSLSQSTAAQSRAMDEPRDGVEVVFNLFGRFSTRPDYALHDEDQLEFIHGLIRRDAAPPDWLMSRLRDRVLLILGVHLPDWLERFVLRTANRGRLRKADRTYFIARKFEPSSASLAVFFHRFGRDARLNIYRGTAVAFVAELARRWKARAPDLAPTERSPEPAARGSIFISYDRQNRKAVERLHRSIVDMGGDCWFDSENLAPGGDWEREIRSQIRHGVQLFIAVISDQTEHKPGSEGVVFEEWREAFKRAQRIIPPRRFILPVVVDVDCSSPDPSRYPNLMNAFAEFERYTFGLAPGGVPDDHLVAALTAQIKLIRSEQT